MDRAGGYRSHLQDPPYRFPGPLFLILTLLIGGLFMVSMASAEENPCGEFYTTAPGDDLNRIAVVCETSVPALLAANPGLAQGDLLLPGQILRITGGDIIPVTGSEARTYTVVSGDTLSAIAARYGTSVSSLLQANPQIVDRNLIYPGQIIVVPLSPPTPATDPNIIPDTGTGELIYTIQRGDTLSKIAVRYGISTASLVQRNTQIANPDLIFPGQQIVIPGSLPVPTPLPPTPEPATIVFPTPEPTPAVLPPAPPTDIIPETGEILYLDDFSVPGIWFTAVQENLSMEYAEDGYRIMNNAANSIVSSVRALDLTDTLLETRAARVGGPQTGYYGVVCRWQDISNYYALLIGSDGFFGIARILDGQLTFLGEGRITTGPIYLDTATNLVGGSCIGNTLTLFVNGQNLIQVQDQTFSSGYPGLVVATRAAGGTHVHFDDFLIRR